MKEAYEILCCKVFPPLGIFFLLSSLPLRELGSSRPSLFNWDDPVVFLAILLLYDAEDLCLLHCAKFRERVPKLEMRFISKNFQSSESTKKTRNSVWKCKMITQYDMTKQFIDNHIVRQGQRD